MKYGLMVVGTESSANIGDYIQAIAARQFLPHVDVYIERERLKEYDGEEVKMIMNGYYMHNGNQWPPSKKITPLYVALHINSLVKDYFLTPESISYLKQHEPIGCRDKGTETLLKGKGINAYFSGCLTLTLGKSYKSTAPKEKIYFVDPPITLIHKTDKLKHLLKSFFKKKAIKTICTKMYGSSYSIGEWIRTSKFFFAYREMFDEQILTDAIYITQQSRYYKEHFKTDEERLKEAESLVKKYAKAKFVVTSRIHCALPCLSLGTKVLYVYNDLQKEASYCRMDGLLQLFNVIHWDGNKLYSDLNAIKGCKINELNCPPNKTEWEKYAQSIAKRCENFIG